MGRLNTTPPVIIEALPTKTGIVTPASDEERKPILNVQPVQTDVVIEMLRPAISWPGMIGACLVCLLLGSLMRSLFSAADFIIYLPEGVVVPDGEMWRECKRILEWRVSWNQNLIIAIARRA